MADRLIHPARRQSQRVEEEECIEPESGKVWAIVGCQAHSIDCSGAMYASTHTVAAKWYTG